MDEEGSTPPKIPSLALSDAFVLRRRLESFIRFRELDLIRMGTFYSDEVTNCAEQVKKQCNGRYSSDNPLKVTILGPRWGTSYLDSSFLSRELAIHLAKLPQVEVTFLVPENQCNESDKREAARYGVTLVRAKKQPGFDEPTDWLYFPPRELKTDIVIGAGETFGKIAQVFKESHHCKNINIISGPLEEYAILLEKKRILEQKIECHEMCNKTVGVSQMADLAVAPGPKMYAELSASLSYHNKDIFELTPGILSEFSDVKHATDERKNFRILMFGSGDPNNFEQEGLKTAAEAVAELKDKSYHLLYVGAAEGTQKQFAERFSQCGVSKSQQIIRSLPESEEELKSLFCEADLAIMSLSEQGFGMMALAALSSGLPVLVHEDSGLGVALKEVNSGTSSTVESEDANVWAKAIRKKRKTERKLRLQEAASLRSHYDKKYSWEKQCRDLVQKMVTMVTGQLDQTL